MTKQKYHLTIHEKLEIIRFCDQNPNLTKVQMAKETGKILNRPSVNSRTIFNALRNREAIIKSCDSPNRVRAKKKLFLKNQF